MRVEWEVIDGWAVVDSITVTVEDDVASLRSVNGRLDLGDTGREIQTLMELRDAVFERRRAMEHQLAEFRDLEEALAKATEFRNESPSE